jgi:N-acyl-D-amino-acid deacylase
MRGAARGAKRLLRLAAAGVLALCAACQAAPVHDIVIRNGRVLDGAGNPWVRADVAIDDGRIAELGTVPARGEREIDAAGRYVAPGFIDMMDQSGHVLLENGAAVNKLMMGVTTVIAGEGGTPVEAGEIGAYFVRLEEQGIGVNFGTYYSATQARVTAMGDVDGAPTENQMLMMKTEVGKAMQAGAFGISTALIYPPGSFHGTQELIELATVAASCDGFYATHMRDESGALIEAIEEAVEIGEQSGARVEIFHLKAAYAPGWGVLMPEAIAAIEAARARGVDVAADLYPYPAGGTGLDITVPNRVWVDGEEKGLERLRDLRVREQLKREVAAGSQPGWSNLVEASGGWNHIVLANAFNPEYERYHGRSIADIGADLGRHPADAAWDILLDALPERAMALFFMMDERDIELAIRQPWTSIGSDAAAAASPGEVDALGLPHPRAYGTFPRVIAEYVKERGVLTLPQAVRKMTSWPATRMGLFERGVIREGLRADVVVFDYAEIEDRATWQDPTATPNGIDYVIVNGELAIDDGRYTGVMAGDVLRHQCDTP